MEVLPEPLAIWHSDAGRARLSNSAGWRDTLEWFRTVRPLVSSRAYASFLLNAVSSWARSERDWSAPQVLLWEAMRFGRPTLADSLMHAARWLLPKAIIRPLKTALIERRHPGGQ